MIPNDDDDDDMLSAGGINIAHLNVASILGAHKFEMLKKQVELSNLGVFCASESWLSANIPDNLVAIDGFNSARLDRSWRENETDIDPKKGGGLICYARQNLRLNEFRYAKLNHSNCNLEMQWVSLDMPHMRRIVLINIYRPPQGDYKKACKLIHNAIKDADLKDNVEIFVLGDFNIDMKDRKSTKTKELDFTMSTWGLKQLIKGLTRMGLVDGVIKGSCIDNIFSNSESIAESKIINWNISDHLMVGVKRKRTKAFHHRVMFKGRSYKNYVREDLQEILVNDSWDQFYNSRSPASCWDIIVSRVRSYLNVKCPQKLFKVKEVREPWVNDEILEEIKDKDRLLRIAKRTRDADDWVRARLERNRVGRLIEQAKADFLKEQQEELADDPKKFWRLVKAIVPGKKSKSANISLTGIDDNGDEINIDEPLVADFVNKFYCSIGPKLAEEHKIPWRFYGDESVNIYPHFVTDYDQILSLCKEIKTTKSSGIDDVPSRVFKDAFRVLVPQLVYLFNLSFSTSTFPDEWKQATVIPLFKGGDKTEVSNYRPISLLPLPGKLLEKVVHSKLSVFLEGNKLISANQSGFRKGFSTMSSVADLTDRLFSNSNKGLTSLAAFVDLRKAFDTVDHGILKNKLRCYGIADKNLDWCSSYLESRGQRVLANGVFSSAEEIVCGVPQGSVLGPLFFILYVNDVQNAVTNSNLQLYADDTVIYTSGVSAEVAACKLQPSLNQFYEWCQANKLSLNVTKTKLMVFGTRHKVKKAKDITIKVGDAPLQIVPSYKYLGITLDSTLSFNHYVKTVANIVAYKANLLAKIRKFLTDSVSLKIYKSMILPYFDYGDVIYNTSNIEGLDKLQRLQNRCLKICKGFDIRFDTKELHTITKTPMLEMRRTAHINNFMYIRLKRLHLVDDRNINTRAHDAPLFKICVPKIEAYKRSVEYAGSLQWNSLPVDIRSIDTHDVFKAKQKTIMISSV